MVQYFEEIIEFVYEYHDMMVDKIPSLYETNDLDCLRAAFMGTICEHIVKMMFLDPGRSVKDVTEDTIGDTEFIEGSYEDAIELTKFGCEC